MKSCFIDQLGGILGVRDTRRVIGEYTVTYEDSQQGPAFSDSVARKYGHIDGNQLFVGGMKSGFSYPYRAMLPRGVDGLLVARALRIGDLPGALRRQIHGQYDGNRYRGGHGRGHVRAARGNAAPAEHRRPSPCAD